jgi:hypothetical protein
VPNVAAKKSKKKAKSKEARDHGHDRAGIERLVRYVARPPVWAAGADACEQFRVLLGTRIGNRWSSARPWGS